LVHGGDRREVHVLQESHGEFVAKGCQITPFLDQREEASDCVAELPLLAIILADATSATQCDGLGIDGANLAAQPVAILLIAGDQGLWL
jgi:hypothetical protein